jgi:hypothetical protein
VTSHLVVVAVKQLHEGTAAALVYAKSLSPDCEAVCVERDPVETAELRDRWQREGMEVPLIILPSPGPSLTRPLVEYVRAVRRERGVDLVTVVIPEPAKRGLRESLVHGRTAFRLKYRLMREPGVVVTNVVYRTPVARAGYQMPRALPHAVIVLVPDLHRGVLPALAYARTLSADCEAVSVEINRLATPRLRQKWQRYRPGMPLTVLKSPWRSLTGPVLHHLATVRAEKGVELVTVIIPEFATRRWWHPLLHNQSGLALKLALLAQPGVVVTNVRYQLPA